MRSAWPSAPTGNAWPSERTRACSSAGSSSWTWTAGRSSLNCWVLLMDVDSREVIAQYDFPSPLITRETGVRALAFSPDGRWLVAGTRDGQIHAWDTSLRSPERSSRQAHRDRVT